MQSKYKIGLLRGNLLAAALLLALLAPAAPTLPEALLLWLATGWLGVTAVLLEFSHRRPAMVPWQLLPSLLLAALLWASSILHIRGHHWRSTPFDLVPWQMLRERTGVGQKITSGLYETAVYWVGQWLANYGATGEPSVPMPEMREGMCGKYSATRVRDRPSASKLAPPRYDDTTAMPILLMTLSRPSFTALR